MKRWTLNQQQKSHIKNNKQVSFKVKARLNKAQLPLKAVSRVHVRGQHCSRLLHTSVNSVSSPVQTGSTLNLWLSHICRSAANTQPAADWLGRSQWDSAYSYSPWPDSKSRGCVAFRAHTVHHIGPQPHSGCQIVAWFLWWLWDVHTKYRKRKLSFVKAHEVYDL